MSEPVPKHFKVLLSERQLRNRVKELAEQISKDYAGRDLHLVCVLKGAYTILADLVRNLSVPVTFDFLAVSSYGDSTNTTGVVKITKDLDEPVESKHLIVLEDIIDTGLTMHYLYENFKSRNVASLSLFSLLDRPHRRKVDIKMDYVGFVIPDKYVVGYGLDFEQKYRQLKNIYAIN